MSTMERLDAEDSPPSSSDLRSDTIAVAVPARRFAPAIKAEPEPLAPSRSISSRRTRFPTANSTTDNSLSSQIKLQRGQKRKARTLLAAEEGKESPEDEEESQQGSRKRSQTIKKPAKVSRGPKAPLPSMDNIVLQNEKDIDSFTSSFQSKGSVGSQHRILGIHLDTSKRNEYTAFRLALALNLLHLQDDGTNPHHFKTINLVVKGNILFTRYSYHLASPALSKYASRALQRLVTNKASESEKARMDYTINSTETVVAKALLGLRGLSQVLITGDGEMENDFAEVLKRTLTQLPGTPIAAPVSETVLDPPPSLFREGIIKSAVYHANSKLSDVSRSERVEEERFGMANMVVINKVDLTRHKDNWADGKYLTDEEHTVEMGWMI